jgi:low affinity Fe/Cu permease
LPCARWHDIVLGKQQRFFGHHEKKGCVASKNEDNKMDNGNKKTERRGGFFERFSSVATQAAGSTYAFIIALALVFAWAVSGPFFGYSEQWQLVINTGTTIITFLMVFIIQKSQNKDSLAIQLKLNELVAAHKHASNRLVNVENMTEDELKVIRKYYAYLSEYAKQEESLQQSHSIDEAEASHEFKKRLEKDLENC